MTNYLKKNFKFLTIQGKACFYYLIKTVSPLGNGETTRINVLRKFLIQKYYFLSCLKRLFVF
jgi:hypothetical protein